MTERRLVGFGSPLEKAIGFSRAVRSGGFVAVSGTAPLNGDGTSACIGDVYGQTRRCLAIVESALRGAGASLANVIRTRIMLTDISRWEDAARAHGEVFAEIRPACTFVQVRGFIRPEWLVEIEADAQIFE
jgi:enamine deaminase RidA (YjgF/YER057c/UK114 family)